MTPRKPKVVKAWAGFTDGRIDTWSQDTAMQHAVFRFRYIARQRYEDVRPVRIIPGHGRKRRRK